MRSAALRPLLALLLLAGFGARAAALGVVHRCPASGAAAHGDRHGEREPGHRHPGGSSEQCECVGQSCSAAAAVPVSRPAFSDPVVAFGPAQRPAAATTPRATPKHLLPLAQGPPAVPIMA